MLVEAAIEFLFLDFFLGCWLRPSFGLPPKVNALIRIKIFHTDLMKSRSSSVSLLRVKIFHTDLISIDEEQVFKCFIAESGPLVYLYIFHS